MCVQASVLTATALPNPPDQDFGVREMGKWGEMGIPDPFPSNARGALGISPVQNVPLRKRPEGCSGPGAPCSHTPAVPFQPLGNR